MEERGAMPDVESSVARLDRAVRAVDENYVLFGSLYGRAIPIAPDLLRRIIQTALEAADGD